MSESSGNKCDWCGGQIDPELEYCEGCFEDDMALAQALKQARNGEDVITAWLTWRNGKGKRKDEFSAFLDNCKVCGKLMWIHPFERRKNLNAGQYCSRSCKGVADKEAGRI